MGLTYFTITSETEKIEIRKAENSISEIIFTFFCLIQEEEKSVFILLNEEEPGGWYGMELQSNCLVSPE